MRGRDGSALDGETHGQCGIEVMGDESAYSVLRSRHCVGVAGRARECLQLSSVCWGVLPKKINLKNHITSDAKSLMLSRVCSTTLHCVHDTNTLYKHAWHRFTSSSYRLPLTYDGIGMALNANLDAVSTECLLAILSHEMLYFWIKCNASSTFNTAMPSTARMVEG